ncbi:MAG: Stage II sporulation protein P (SpoIIP) [Pelotomaculum sp. PtaU1.Bin035]|nr:MAG: Stage II sporulation protein P (SpoIIP) [Pelotomaculum sp. PtaU1.Bin035]
MCLAPARRFRCMRPGLARRLFALAGILIILLFLLFKMFTGAAIFMALKQAVDKMPEGVITVFYQREPLRILKIAMPVLCWSSLEGDSSGTEPSQIFWDSLETVVRVNLCSPSAVLRSQIPILTMLQPPAAVAVSRSSSSLTENFSAPAKTAFALPGEGLVIIYNTHTGETYSMTDRVERLDGRQGGVVTVAAALQEALESKYGIKVARSDHINDLNYDTSYQESEKTARELLAANSKARVVFDIHRDSAKPREQSVVNVNGQNVAPLLFIIGSGSRRPPSGWRQNLAFATELSNKTNEIYPGLSLGVRINSGSYNQYLHPHSVLVEFGTSKNSTEEAVRSAVLFADVVARVIME